MQELLGDWGGTSWGVRDLVWNRGSSGFGGLCSFPTMEDAGLRITWILGLYLHGTYSLHGLLTQLIPTMYYAYILDRSSLNIHHCRFASLPSSRPQSSKGSGTWTWIPAPASKTWNRLTQWGRNSFATAFLDSVPVPWVALSQFPDLADRWLVLPFPSSDFSVGLGYLWLRSWPPIYIARATFGNIWIDQS